LRLLTAAVIVVAAGSLGSIARAASTHGGTTTNIYLLDVRTGGVRQVTQNKASQEDKLAYSPTWSPNGLRIAFAETLCHECASYIHVTSVQPSPRWLGPALTLGFTPRWSPNGRRIAYVGDDGSLYTIRPDGRGRRLLARGGIENADPAWSPDSTRIAFTRQLTATTWQVQVVQASGGAPTAVTDSSGQAVNPSWARDGKHLAFSLRQPDGMWQLYTVDSNGGNLRRLSDGSGSDSFPTWSPDDSSIAFVREQGIHGTAVFVMPARGGRARRISPTWLSAVQPQWAPRGSVIAFAAQVNWG
jgi:TolB protein